MKSASKCNNKVRSSVQEQNFNRTKAHYEC